MTRITPHSHSVARPGFEPKTAALSHRPAAGRNCAWIPGLKFACPTNGGEVIKFEHLTGAERIHSLFILP